MNLGGWRTQRNWLNERCPRDDSIVEWVMTERTYHVVGVPLRSGSLYPGNENDAKAYREVGLLDRLRAAGCSALDDGDVPVPDYLPHHSIPPIRSWPGPRIAWDYVREHVAPHLRQPGHLPLLVGCDCSVVVGTTQALLGVTPDVHVLYLDGDFDDAAPDPDRCQSAAAQAVWLLTNDSPFWAGPALDPSQVTVLGWSKPSQSGLGGSSSISLDEVRRVGAAAAARQALDAIAPSAAVVLHFDIDVVQERELPAAYFPHEQGLRVSELGEVLAIVLKDPRIRIIEISEYASLRDHDRRWVTKLVDLFVSALR